MSENTVTVVVADDSPTMRRIVGGVLSAAGFDVVLAEDGVEAVQAVFRTMPDVVILDVQMPRLSGYVAARLFKDDWQTADLPVIFLTSLNAASDRYWGARAGAERFLTKDFEAPELVDAVSAALAAGERARGGRAALKAEPLELSTDDVLTRVCDLFDRTLFEASLTQDVTAIAADVHGFEETVAAVLTSMEGIVDCDLVGVMLLGPDGLAPDSTYVSVAREVTDQHYREFLVAVAEASDQATGGATAIHELSPMLADARGRLGAADPDSVENPGMATFLSMPLRAGGRLLGLLALSSGTANAFGESVLTTLRLVAPPTAVVIDHARLAGVRA
ncbi:MAG TPA: response regulator [Candidatus Angelobacter sp.]|nr:response regulator [Candidatus Angelobacter sp.]